MATINNLFTSVDSNGTGDLDLEEFLQVCDRLRGSNVVLETDDSGCVHASKVAAKNVVHRSHAMMSHMTKIVVGRHEEKFTKIVDSK